MLIDLTLVLIGIALLYAGGEALVRGAIALAKRIGLSSLAIGLTVVAFATSAPELAATLLASVQGANEIAIGNVMGSNIANIGLILGATALLRPLLAEGRIVRREIPLMILAGGLLYPVFSDGEVSRLEGVVLFTLLVLVVWFQIRGDQLPTVTGEEIEAPGWGLGVSLAVVAGGILLLVGGAKVLVDGAVGLARVAGIPERVIGLTLVAVGTSLPELASSLVAARKGEADIVLGNIIGSNVFNVLCILGVASMVRPIPVTQAALGLDFWVMMFFAFAMLPVLSPRLGLRRWQGVIFLGCYGAYVLTLFL